MPVYLLRANQCPAIQMPAALLDESDGLPLTAERILAGASGPAGLLQINQNAARLDNVGRHGGAHAHCIKTGLALTAGAGLTLNIGTGHVGIDAGATLDVATTLILPDGAYNAGDLTVRCWIWMNETTGVVQVTSSTVPPAGRYALLGSARTNAGAIVDIDYSGRLELRGGMLYRRTGDEGAPTDAPPAVQVITRTGGGEYLWDGERYQAVWEPLPLSDLLIPAGETVVIPAGKGVVVPEITVDGTLNILGVLGWI